VTDVNIVGAGQLDLDSAVAARVALGPVSTSFGSIPAGSGQTQTRTVRVTNLTAGALTLSLGVSDTVGAGMTFSVAPGTINLAAGQSTAVVVTMTAAKAAAAGDHQAMLTVKAGGTTLAHAVVYAFVR
jgi:minor extracellular serine protease Vpr